MIDIYILKEHIEKMRYGREHIELRDSNGETIGDIEKANADGSLYIGFNVPGGSYTGLSYIDEPTLTIRGSYELEIRSGSYDSRVVIYGLSIYSMEVIE